MGSDEFHDLNLRHWLGGTDRQFAIRLDDEGNRFSFGTKYIIDGNGHGKKYTKGINESVSQVES
jgi:hypothetical protein